MAVDLRGNGLVDRLAYYIRGQAPGTADYLLQEALTGLFGWVPGLPGIALRGLVYRLMMKMDGFAAIEPGVRLRHARNIRLGANVYLDYGVYLHGCPQGIEIGADTFIMHNTELHVFNFRDLPHAFIKVGRGTFIGESVVIRGQGGVTIGDDVLIAPMAKILAVNHNFRDVSRPVIDQGITGRGIVIEDGAWIGAGAAVLDGVRIGRGAVIGANAVVSRDVPPRTVSVGAPSRVVKELGGGGLSATDEAPSLLSSSDVKPSARRRARISAQPGGSYPGPVAVSPDTRWDGLGNRTRGSKGGPNE